MRYKKFIIHNYRGISTKTEINISKESLIPIIGKNESGKTTFLEAIFTFDFYNDDEHNGRHISNIENFYSTEEQDIIIEAIIEIDEEYNWESIFSEKLQHYKQEYEDNFGEEEDELNFLELTLDKHEDLKLGNWEYLKIYQMLSKESGTQTLSISRNLKTKEYNCSSFVGIDNIINNEICKEIIRFLPYMLYFDDFRDRLPEKMYITDDIKSEFYSIWIKYFDELFKQTNNYSIYKLPGFNDRIRKSIIKEVEKELNHKLIKEWSNYQFEKTEEIEVLLEYVDEEVPYLKFGIEEKIIVNSKIKERYFSISDRSKGFYWYLNFMIKLHYNPNKRDNDDKDTIYLLDEPGSYLHAYSLNKLAQQLKKISINNKVIYCTHSHNLLNPEVISINSIRLAEKKDGKINLKRIDHQRINKPSKNSAYQPIFDALEVRPPLLDFDYNKVVLVEGIYDYYCFSMFSKGDLSYFPCVSASSIINQIPFMIFLGKSYVALWDNDSEGRKRLEQASELFGQFESKKFITLDRVGEKSENIVLEDLFDNNELEIFANSDKINKEFLKKIILDLYHSEEREEKLNTFFKKTKQNFIHIEQKINDCFNDC